MGLNGREFVRLALSPATSDPQLFREYSAGVSTPVSNTHALLYNLFMFVGRLIALSVVRGSVFPFMDVHVRMSWPRQVCNSFVRDPLPENQRSDRKGTHMMLLQHIGNF